MHLCIHIIDTLFICAYSYVYLSIFCVYYIHVIGDPKQLPATVFSKETTRFVYKLSDM